MEQPISSELLKYNNIRKESNTMICKKSNDDYICNMSDVSIDIDLGFGTFIALWILGILVFK